MIGGPNSELGVLNLQNIIFKKKIFLVFRVRWETIKCSQFCVISFTFMTGAHYMDYKEGGGKHVFVPLSLNKLHKFICICTVQFALDGWKSARCMKWTVPTFNKAGKACCTVHASRLCKAKLAGTSMNQSLPGSFYSGMPLTPLCWASCLPRLGVVSSTRTGSRWSTPRS